MIARLSPIVNMTVEIVSVRSAWLMEYFASAAARIPPEEDATISVTTGRIHIAVMRVNAWSCFVFLHRSQ